MTATLGAVVRRATGARPATITAPAPEARPAASPAPAHPALAVAIMAMFAVVGAPPPHAIWPSVIERSPADQRA